MAAYIVSDFMNLLCCPACAGSASIFNECAKGETLNQVQGDRLLHLQ